MDRFEFKEATPMEEVDNKVVTRRVAATALYELVNSCVLCDEISDILEEIADNLEMEDIGYHFWGADRDEKTKLFTAMQAESITPEFEAECERIDKKYSFTPSEFEKVEIENNICGYEDDED